jgi:hypothetical protein
MLTPWTQNPLLFSDPSAAVQVADLNALAELGKVYQDSLALSAQLRNLSSFRLQQDKVLGRGSLAVVQEGVCVWGGQQIKRVVTHAARASEKQQGMSGQRARVQEGGQGGESTMNFAGGHKGWVSAAWQWRKKVAGTYWACAGALDIEQRSSPVGDLMAECTGTAWQLTYHLSVCPTVRSKWHCSSREGHGVTGQLVPAAPASRLRQV